MPGCQDVPEESLRAPVAAAFIEGRASSPRVEDLRLPADRKPRP